MTPEEWADKIIRLEYPTYDDPRVHGGLRHSIIQQRDAIAVAIKAAQAEQRRKDAALICRWCRDKAPTLTLTEGSQGHSKGVLVHLEQERILGACPAQTILAQEE